MASPTIQQLVNLVESLPDATQTQVLQHLQDYIADLQDEQQWNQNFERTQSALVAATRQIRQQRETHTIQSQTVSS
jgi:hypothetical protein